MKKKIIVVLNVVVVLVALSFILNVSIITQISSVSMGGEVIDTNILESIIRHAKLLIAIPAIICICISFILIVINKKVTMYASIVFTTIALIVMLVNVTTFDSKIVSEDINGDPVLSVSAELVLYKIETDSYSNTSEYVENLIDIVI